MAQKRNASELSLPSSAGTKRLALGTGIKVVSSERSSAGQVSESFKPQSPAAVSKVAAATSSTSRSQSGLTQSTSIGVNEGSTPPGSVSTTSKPLTLPSVGGSKLPIRSQAGKPVSLPSVASKPLSLPSSAARPVTLPGVAAKPLSLPAAGSKPIALPSVAKKPPTIPATAVKSAVTHPTTVNTTPVTLPSVGARLSAQTSSTLPITLPSSSQKASIKLPSPAAKPPASTQSSTIASSLPKPSPKLQPAVTSPSILLKQSILAQLNATQTSRFEAFRRSSFTRSNVKKVSSLWTSHQ